MGVTVRMYLKEFERKASEGEMEITLHSPHKVIFAAKDVGTKIPISAVVTRNTREPVACLKGAWVEEDDDDGNSLDLDFGKWL